MVSTNSSSVVAGLFCLAVVLSARWYPPDQSILIFDARKFNPNLIN
jgi:hypothetical protein